MSYILRPYQQEAVDAGVNYFNDKSQKKPVLMVLPTAAGKSLVLSEIARTVDAPLIVFQPTREILIQNYNKMMDYQIQGVCIYSASMRQKNIGNITLATIGSVYRKPEDFKMFKYIIIDECFPKGTLVDGNPIESLKVGEVIRSYNHNTHQVEYKKIKAISKRKVVGNLIRVNISNDTSFICTENHPIYTLDYGYISALSLSLCKDKPLVLYIPINESQEDLALQNMWERMPSTKSFKKEYLLQSGMRLAGHRQQENKEISKLRLLWERIYSTRQVSDNGRETRKILLLSRVWSCIEGSMGQRSSSNTNAHSRIKRAVIHQNEDQQSDVVRRQQRTNDSENEGKNISFSWWKWRTYEATDCPSKCNGIANRTRNRNSNSKGYISKFTSLLQSRFSRPISKTCNRSGWQDTQIKEMEVPRQEENRSPQLVRVDSCEILERGDRSRFNSVCGDGYVYNIQVEDNHNYFVNNILVHNCDVVSAKGGMYKKFIDAVGEKLIGLTATPYRMSTDGYGGTIMKFLTRTNPRVFSRVIHVTQTKDLYNQGYLAETEYFPINGFTRSEIKLNSTGADYDEPSERAYYDKTSFDKRLIKVVSRLVEIKATPILVFVKFVREAEELSKALGDMASFVHGEMDMKERDKRVKLYKDGVIKVMVNVGIFSVGYDHPELRAIVFGRPTRSLRLWYQFSGRGLRIHPDKEKVMIVDLCGNYPIFGKIEDLQLVERGGDNLWCVMSNGRQLTNVYLDQIMKD